MDKKIESSMLQVLVALSDGEGGVSHAAHTLGVTQSAVSQSLKSLENKLGFSVVTRQGKGVILTEQGRRIAKVAKQYFKRIDETIEQIQTDADRVAGEIVLGTLYGLGKSWVVTVLVEFLKKHPDINVRVLLDFPEGLTKKFESGEIDCLILPEYLVPAYAEKWSLHEEYTTLVFPDHADFPIHQETTLAELQKYPVLMFEAHDPLFYRWCRERFKNVPKNLKSRLTVNSFGHLLQGVHAGLGVAVVPTHVFDRSFFKDKIKTLGSESHVLNNMISFAARNEETENLKIKTLFTFLKATSPSILEKYERD